MIATTGPSNNNPATAQPQEPAANNQDQAFRAMERRITDMVAKSLEMFAAQIPNIVRETVSACLLTAPTNQHTIQDGGDTNIPTRATTATITEAPHGREVDGTVDLSSRPTSVRISALPSRLVGQIARGEFVNFNSILAATTQGPDTTPPSHRLHHSRKRGGPGDRPTIHPTTRQQNKHVRKLARCVERLHQRASTFQGRNYTTTPPLSNHHHPLQSPLPSKSMDRVRHPVPPKPR